MEEQSTKALEAAENLPKQLDALIEFGSCIDDRFNPLKTSSFSSEFLWIHKSQLPPSPTKTIADEVIAGAVFKEQQQQSTSFQPSFFDPDAQCSVTL